MNFSGNGLKSAAAATALSLVLVACGGSEPASSSSEAPAATEVEAAAEETVNTVEEVAETTTEAAEEVAETVTEEAEAVVEEAADAATDVVEEATEVVEEATEAVEDVVEEVAEAAEPATDDRVSAEIVAQYASLTGDAGNGRRVFTQCMSCHAVQEGRNMAGPSLYGIIGRTSGTIEGFRYSDANANSGIVWTEETMFAYLERPQAFIPGTFMAFPGLPRPQDRADVIAYLKEQSN